MKSGEKQEMTMERKPVTVMIESCVDGSCLAQTLAGEYAYRDDAHLVVYTDYTGNAITKNGMEIREEKLLLHRTGAMEGDMLFDPQSPTVFRYSAFPVKGEFILYTERYELTVTAEGLRVGLQYRLCSENGGEDIEGKQTITVKPDS